MFMRSWRSASVQLLSMRASIGEPTIRTASCETEPTMVYAATATLLKDGLIDVRAARCGHMPRSIGKFLLKTLPEQRPLLLSSKRFPLDTLCHLHTHRVPSDGKAVDDASRISPGPPFLTRAL